MRAALLFAGYPLFHLIVRLAVSEGLEYDEAEQVVLTQSLALGYATVAAQPPLYTWLQYGFFALFGMNVFALAGLRALLQILTQAALYRSALLILGDRTLALLAALSLWLIPQFSVEAMRKTHSVLATCLAAVLLHALLRVWKSGGTVTYVWLGAVLGLGVLAKYNFAIVAAVMLLAALSVEPLRRRLLDRRLGLGLGVAAMLVAPHFAWLLHHLSAVTAQVGTRMDVWTQRQWTIRWALRSWWSFGKDPFGYLPPVLLHLVVFGRPREAISEAAATVARLLERFWLLAFGALTVAIVIISMARFHAHWLQPFLVMLPLYMFLRRPSASASPRRLTLFAVLLGAGIVLIMGWRFVELWEGHRVRALSRLNTPYPELARRIEEAGFRDGGVIVADHHMVAGNLRFVLQNVTVVTTRMAEAGAVVPPGPCLIVWDARKQQEVPERLAPWVTANGAPTPPPTYVEARGQRADRALFRLGFIRFPACRKPGAT